MLTVLPSPLSPSEVQLLRAWLNKQPEAELFRHVIASNIAALQAEAGELLIQGEDQQDQSGELAKEKAREAAAFYHVLAAMQRFRETDNELIHVTLSVDAPFTPVQTPPSEI